jgi:hypothetical protein
MLVDSAVTTDAFPRTTSAAMLATCPVSLDVCHPDQYAARMTAVRFRPGRRRSLELTGYFYRRILQYWVDMLG